MLTMPYVLTFSRREYSLNLLLHRGTNVTNATLLPQVCCSTAVLRGHRFRVLPDRRIARAGFTSHTFVSARCGHRNAAVGERQQCWTSSHDHRCLRCGGAACKETTTEVRSTVSC